MNKQCKKLPVTVPELANRISQEMPNATLKEKCKRLKELMVLSPEECHSVKQATTQQYKTSLWGEFRNMRVHEESGCKTHAMGKTK